MEKLELKHLAPYLPYGIPARLSQEGIFNLDNEYPEIFYSRKLGIIKRISFFDDEITGELTLTDKYSFDFDYIEEIEIALRPLSDLTKEIEVNGEKFVFLENLHNIDFEGYFCCQVLDDIKSDLIFGHIEKIPYLFMEKLLELHFDVFYLIEKNLAIDINTL